MAVQYWITSGNRRSHNAVDTALLGVRPGLSPGSETYHYITLDKLPKVPGMGQVKTANHQKVQAPVSQLLIWHEIDQPSVRGSWYL